MALKGSGTPIQIRIAEKGDASTLWKIVNESFEEYRNSEAPSSALLESESQVYEVLSKGFEQALICFYGSEPAGAVRFYIENGLYFRRLAVLPEFRGRGLSKAMIKWLESYAKNHGERKIWCRTRASVARNMHLYESLNYTISETMTVERNGKDVAVVTFQKELS